jgi:AraC family transcriptional regulator
VVLECDDPGPLPALDRPRFLEPDLWLHGLLERLDRALRTATPSPLTVDDLATELIAQATRRVAGRMTPPPPWVDRVRQTVREATELPAVSDLAREVGVHRVYLARAFREHCGVSITGYMRRVRLERTKRLLAGPLSLAEVATEAGFSDQSHMTRAVRAAFGATPRALRLGLHAFKTRRPVPR